MVRTYLVENIPVLSDFFSGVVMTRMVTDASVMNDKHQRELGYWLHRVTIVICYPFFRIKQILMPWIPLLICIRNAFLMALKQLNASKLCKIFLK